MDCLEGETISEIMKKGRKSLSNKDADDILAAYIELRTSSLECSRLTLYSGRNPFGYIFPFDNDGGRYLEDRRDFKSFMRIRLDTPLFSFVFPIHQLHPLPEPREKVLTNRQVP